MNFYVFLLLLVCCHIKTEYQRDQCSPIKWSRLHKFTSSIWHIRHSNIISKEKVHGSPVSVTLFSERIKWIRILNIGLQNFIFTRIGVRLLYVLGSLVSMLYGTNERIRLPIAITVTRALPLNVFPALGLVAARYRLNLTFSTSDLFARPATRPPVPDQWKKPSSVFHLRFLSIQIYTFLSSEKIVSECEGTG